MDHEHLFIQETTYMDLRFLCNDASLYWHESSRVLSPERIHHGKPGNLVFRKNKDYPAFYVYDESEAGYFWFVAVDKYSENAFRIYRRHVSLEEFWFFNIDYNPKRAREIGYPIKNG